MHDQYLLEPIVSGNEISQELRRRKKQEIFKTVSTPDPELIAERIKGEEAEGWKFDRQNAKSVRMVRSKPLDEKLEDEIWCILAQMGFNEMSEGREFCIPTESEAPPQQIDVFAKDDEAIVVVECAHLDSPGEKNMAPLIEKVRSISGGGVFS